MWVITTQGFYSAVAHRDEPDKVIVRARTREDIEALRRADPRHRAVRGRRRPTTATARSSAAPSGSRPLAQLASAIDYDNFKNAVAERQGPERAALYGVVWRELRRLQQARVTT